MEITQEYLKSILKYEDATGDFVWIKKHSRKINPNSRAGGLNLPGYVVIGINGKVYYAHRLAWLYVHGEWPKQIDHRDGNKANNRMENLRVATHQQNILNAKIANTNTSGHKGVCWHKAAKKWSASITVNGKPKHLGLFTEINDASSAYMNAAKEIQPEFARER